MKLETEFAVLIALVFGGLLLSIWQVRFAFGFD